MWSLGQTFLFFHCSKIETFLEIVPFFEIKKYIQNTKPTVPNLLWKTLSMFFIEFAHITYICLLFTQFFYKIEN